MPNKYVPFRCGSNAIIDFLFNIQCDALDVEITFHKEELAYSRNAFMHRSNILVGI